VALIRTRICRTMFPRSERPGPRTAPPRLAKVAEEGEILASGYYAPDQIVRLRAVLGGWGGAQRRAALKGNGSRARPRTVYKGRSPVEPRPMTLLTSRL
jgi:hypothetical protein